MEPTDIIVQPSLGNAYRDARNLAILLRKLNSGMTTYQQVVSALEAKYGADFKNMLLQEVSR